MAMAQKKPRLRILRRGKQKAGESAREIESDKLLKAGDILVYNPIVQDAFHIDDHTGKMYLCLGEASTEELGKIGDALSSTFTSIRIIAVMGEEGAIDYFLDEELELAEGKDEQC